MKINISNEKENNLNKNEFDILIKSSEDNDKITKLVEYINNFEKYLSKKTLVNDNNNVIEIRYEEIIYFFSDKKYNYCKTKDSTYRVKSKLYEIEELDPNFIRISKCCVINITHVKCFDMRETGKIIVLFDNGSEEYVSRRKIGKILRYMNERSI